jgi:hypothetical protein
MRRINIMNAKKEILNHICDRDVTYITISIYDRPEDNYKRTIAGTLPEVLPKLDFTYNSDFGIQLLYGTIWYSDGSWSDREEYDGSEWWIHRIRPALPFYTGNLL